MNWPGRGTFKSFLARHISQVRGFASLTRREPGGVNQMEF